MSSGLLLLGICALAATPPVCLELARGGKLPPTLARACARLALASGYYGRHSRSRALAHTLLGDLEHKAGRAEQAIGHYRTALECRNLTSEWEGALHFQLSLLMPSAPEHRLKAADRLVNQPVTEATFAMQLNFALQDPQQPGLCLRLKSFLEKHPHPLRSVLVGMALAVNQMPDDALEMAQTLALTQHSEAPLFLAYAWMGKGRLLAGLSPAQQYAGSVVRGHRCLATASMAAAVFLRYQCLEAGIALCRERLQQDGTGQWHSWLAQMLAEAGHAEAPTVAEEALRRLNGAGQARLLVQLGRPLEAVPLLAKDPIQLAMALATAERWGEVADLEPALRALAQSDADRALVNSLMLSSALNHLRLEEPELLPTRNLPPALEAAVLQARALAAWLRGDREETEKFHRRAYQLLGEGSPECLALLVGQGRFDEARECLRREEELPAGSVRRALLAFQRADLELDFGDYEAAARHLAAARALPILLPETRLRLEVLEARCRAAGGQAVVLERLEQAAESFSPYHRMLCRLHLAQAALSLGDRAQAGRLLQGLEVPPGLDELYCYLMGVAFQDRQYLARSARCDGHFGRLAAALL